jgi:hypothetical protein
MSKTVIIVGAGILGCVAASELLEAGLNVIIITEPDGERLNIKSQGIGINSELIPRGIGGGANIWSSLSALITEKEWEFFSTQGAVTSVKYSELVNKFKRASLYGFPSVGLVNTTESILGFKTYFKPNRTYNFSDLLRERQGLKIITGTVQRFKISNSEVSIEVKSDNKFINLTGHKLILAAGGLGNFKLFSKFSAIFKTDLFLHVKGYVGKIKLTNKGEQFISELGYNFKGSMIYYRGYTGGDCANYLQIIPCKYYHTDCFVELIQIYRLLKSTNFLKVRSLSSALRAGSHSSQFLYLVKILLGSVFPIFLWGLHKLFRVHARNNHAKIILHFSPDAAELNIRKNILEINQGEVNYESGYVLLNKFFTYMNDKGYCSKFESGLGRAQFQNSNHYMGTLYKFFTKHDLGYLKGRFAQFPNSYALGTSNIWFKNNVNPTLLALCMSFFTIDEIIKDLSID